MTKGNVARIIKKNKKSKLNVSEEILDPERLVEILRAPEYGRDRRR